MKKFFENVWTKRVVSLLSGFYAFIACYFCYCSIFYNIEISSHLSLCLLTTGVSILALVIMLYTRKQLVTIISSVIILPVMLPAVLFWFGNWSLIIPIIATGIIILLLSGAGEGFKTAFGTIFLLMYIFGALGYFLFTSFFVTSAKTTTVDKGVSPSGQYRYEVINTEDSSNGSTAVYVEPNYADVSHPFMTLSLKDMSRIVHLERPIAESAQVQWSTMTRGEITAQLNSLSDSIVLHLSEDHLKSLGYTYDQMLALTDIKPAKKAELGYSVSDISTIYLDALSAQQLALFGIGKTADGRYYVLEPSAKLLEELEKEAGSTVFFSEMSSDWQEEYNVTKDDSVLLSTLTDENLAMFGIPESGDVMTFNGKVCFRYYVAILEEYFNVDDRSFSISLIG